MKQTLIIGLGSPLLGDEGIGFHVAGDLTRDPRLPEETEVLYGGTDLLRHVTTMEGRRRIILIDAMLDNSESGSISVFEQDDLPKLEDQQEHVHHLSVAQAIKLLQLASPSLTAVRFTLIAISINSAELGSQLSPSLSAKMPCILNRVLDELD